MFKHVRTLFLLAALLLPWTTQAQVVSSCSFQTGVDASRWVTLTSAATTISFNVEDNGTSTLLPIGFSFAMGEDTFTQFSVSTNGRIRLGSTVVTNVTTNSPFSATNAVNNMPLIAPYARDLSVNAGDGNYVKYELTGTSPNRVLVVEAQQSNTSASSSSSARYQVLLYENSSKIVLLYGANSGTASSCQIGVGMNAGDVMTINPSTHAVSYGNSSTTSSSWPGTGRYYEMTFPTFGCVAPQLGIALSTTDSAYLSWTGTAASYTIEYATSAFTPGAGQATAITTSGNAYVLANLAPQTQYHYAVRATCAGGDTSYWATSSFYTQCVTTSVPYAFGFETTDPAAACWGYHRAGASASLTMPNSAYNSPHAGSYALYSHIPNNADVHYWAVMPGLDTPLDSLLLTFYMKKTSASASYQAPVLIGYMTNADDYSTFVQTGAVLPSSTTYEKYQIAFPNTIDYPAGARITFMFHNASGQYNYVLIDDVQVDYQPTCPAATALNVSASVSSAVLSWSTDASCTTIPSAYTLSYALVGDTALIATETVTGNSHTLTGLAADSSYRVWITPNCGSDGNGYSDSIDFTMHHLPCATFSYTDTAEIGQAASMSNQYPLPATNYNQFCEMLYTASDMGSDTMTITHFALHRSPTYTSEVTNLDDVDVYFANVSATTLFSSFVQQGTNWQLVKHGMNFTGTGWVEFELDNAFHYDGTSNLLVAVNSHTTVMDATLYFYYTGTTGMLRYIRNASALTYDPATVTGGYASSYRTDIRFMNKQCGAISTCAAPAVVVDSVSDTAAHLVWAPGYQETEWNVYYKLHGATAWRIAAEGLTEGETMLTGLQSGMQYDVAVMGVCEDSLMGTATFNTDCGMVYRSTMPYANDFSSVVTTGPGMLPACWGRSSSSASYPYINANPIGGVDRPMYFYSAATTYSTAILPQFEYQADSLEMTFDMYKGNPDYSGMLIVGVMTDPTDDSSFVGVDTVTVDALGTWTTMEVDLGNYTGTGHYVALRNDASCVGTLAAYNIVYVTNVQVFHRSNCLRPAAAYASNITYEEAQVNIQDADSTDADYNNYVVYYGTVNDINAITDSVVFSGTSAILTDLASQTTYYCWARVLCGDGLSRAVTFNFTTQPPCIEVSGLECQNNTANGTAVLSWFEPETGFTATAYIVSYKSAEDNAWTVDTTMDNYYLMSGILSNTSYQYKVTTVCNDIVGAANSGSFDTRTQCATIANSDSYSSQFPVNVVNNYGYTQSIYPAAELAMMGDTISGLYYRQVNASARPYTYTLDVYLGNTDSISFATTTAWVGASQLTKVADSISWTVNRTGWIYLPFDTVFVRNHNQNLVVAIDNNSNGYLAPYPYWAVSNTAAYRSIQYYSSSADCTPAAPATANAISATVPDISFNAPCYSAVCGTPMLINTAKTEHTLTLRWYPGTNETTFGVDYRLVGDSVWTNFLTNTTLTTSTLTGLLHGETYEVRVSNSCSTDSTYVTVRTFSTQCGQMTVPYAEDFSHQSIGTYSRACWQTGTSDRSLPAVAAVGAHGKMVEMGSGAYLIAPDFVTAASGLQMHLNYWGTTAGNFVYVGVIADPASIQTFVPFDTLTVYDLSVPAAKTVHFDGYTGTAGNICIYMPTGYPTDGQLYVDNIIIEANQYCPDVDSVWVNNETSTGATVNWRADDYGFASSYLVEYGSAGFTPGTGTRMATNLSFFTLSGLTGSTTYDVYVTPVCSTGDTMYTSAVTRFQTACGVANLPYTMNFDLPYLVPQAQTRQLPSCWFADMLYTGTDTATYYAPQIVFTDSYAHSGRNCLYTYYQAVTALPEMNVPIDTLQLTFFARAVGPSYRLAVGVVDSVTPGFAASFVPMDTIDCYGGVNDTLTFCGYTGSGQHIAFRNLFDGSSTTPYSYIYIDDVKVDYRPACMPVENVVRTTATQTTMGIGWSTACGTSQSCQVEYGLHGFAQGQGTLLTTTTNAVTLSGLSYATQYDVYVRSFCANGDTSTWVKGLFSTMACSYPEAVAMFDTAAATTITNYFPASSSNNYGYSQVIYDSAMMADAGFVAGSAVAGFAFYPTVTTGGTFYNHCRVLMKNTAKTEFASATDFDSMDVSNLVYAGDLNWNTVGMRYVEFDAPFLWDGSSNVIVAVDRDDGMHQAGAKFQSIEGSAFRSIYSYNDVLNVNPYTLSNLVNSTNGRSTSVPTYTFYGCFGPDCTAPVATVASHTYEQAVLTWTGDATDYEVNVKTVVSSVWPANVAVNAHTYTATALQPAMEYNWRVRAVCDATTQSDWVEGTFVTDSLPCHAPTALAAEADFGSAEISWTPATDETQWRIHVWNTTFDSTYFVSANPVTVGGFIPGRTYNVAVAAVCGGGLAVSDYSDAISFTTTICAPVTGVTVGTVTGTTAQVSWTAGANSTGSYQIEYGYADFASGDGTIVNATTNSVTLTGLEGETAYDVYVRAVCDSQYPSVWSDKASFETPVVGIHTVDGAANVSLYPNPATNGTTVSVSGVEGEVSVTIVDMNGRTVSSHTMTCSGDCVKQMNVSSLAAGSYFVRIQGEGLNAVKKLVVK